MTKYETLLKSWCDKLIELQITEIKDPAFYGAIMCPACTCVHSRCGDAVYPFMCIYNITGEEKYLNAAKAVIDWSEHNIKRSDGTYFNEKTSNWKGITAFSLMALGDALIYHGHLLDKETKDKWTGILDRMAEGIYVYFDSDSFRPVINYHAGECSAMAIAYAVTGKENYKVKAYEKYEYTKKYFTAEGLLTGEGYPKATDKYCHVDIGYNVEESLPALAIFGHIMKDEEVLNFVCKAFKAHIDFLLPDGAWNNSFGSRANKWTYWGSRTSDGCEQGLCLLAKYDDVFAEACERNFDMLEYCSKDGYLYGGYMYKEYDEEPCTHHSYCHAKSLAAMIDNGFEYKKMTVLPCDCQRGLVRYKSIGVEQISLGDFIATISGTDIANYDGCATTGGSVTMLWHKLTGPIFAATMASYAMSEPRNMQFSRHDDIMPCTTLRLESGNFMSVNEKYAKITASEENGVVTISADGLLKNIRFSDNGASYSLEYTFTKDSFSVKAKCGEDARLIMPVICSKNDSVSVNGNHAVITRNNASISLVSENGSFGCPEDKNFRNFNVVGGFGTFPLYIDIKKDRTSGFTLEITK